VSKRDDDFIADLNKLSDATPDQAETMLAIPEPPPECDSHDVYKFIHEIREFMYEDGAPPDALDRRTDSDLWLCSLVSQVRR